MPPASQVVNLDEYRDLRLMVQGCIKAYLKNGTIQARIAMENTVGTVMRKYRRRQMNFGTYTVTLAEFDGRQVPIIKARRTLPGCPTCGRKDGLLYIRTQKQDLFGPKDLVAYGCMECAEIFARWEPNERSEPDETA